LISQVSKLARKYFSTPPTSERLLSTAGDLYDEKRNRLSPQHAEELLFIKTNFIFKTFVTVQHDKLYLQIRQHLLFIFVIILLGKKKLLCNIG